MSGRKQSKRAKFAHRRRVTRIHSRIFKANAHKPGFLGVVTNLRIDGVQVSSGAGAVFLRRNDGSTS